MSTIVHWDDNSITESSALAYSRKWADTAYTCNDENGNGFVVRPSTGKTIGTYTARGIDMEDPEAMSVDFKGGLWWCDIGDNSAVRDWVNVYTRGEPGPGFHRTLAFTRYRLKYPGGARNAETFLTFPNGDKFIISKTATGSVYKLPKTLKTGDSFNTMTSVFGPSADLVDVSDGTVSKDGEWVFLLKKDELTTIFVYDTTWTEVDTITMSAMSKPEGITIAPDGKTLLVCDDNGGSGGKLQYGIKIPGEYCPAGSTKYDDGSTITGAPPAPAPPVNPCAA